MTAEGEGERMTAPWAGVITPDDEARYEAAGFGRAAGIGTRPALLIIDVQYRTVGDEPKPFFDSVRDFYPTSCGEAGWAAVASIALLLAAFRARSFPVLYPHVAPKQGYDAGRLAAKVPSIMDIPEKGYRFVEEVAPTEGDILIPKRHPSAFFATALTSYLIDLAVDWLVITGCTTSGCVRASVVDAFAYNFRVTVPHDAVYDRSPTVHSVNLFDMAQKYADVTTTADVMRTLPDAA
jgi:maleamate amidohydrolase